MTLLILVSCCSALGLSSPRPELGLGKDVVAVAHLGTGLVGRRGHSASDAAQGSFLVTTV